MKADAKVYAMIAAMTCRQLGSLILQAGYALPSDKGADNLRYVVRSLYEQESIEPELVIENYEEGSI